MPAVSKAQQRFMGMVHAAQKGDMENPSPEVSKAADSMSDKDAKDFASTKHKGLPDKKIEEYKSQLKERIRKIVREMNTTGNVQGYNTPKAFGKPENEKKKGKRLADLTGYSIVQEEVWKKEYKGNDGIIWKKEKETKKSANYVPYYKGHNIDTGGYNFGNEKELLKFIKDYIVSNQIYNKYRFDENINENRWLELKREETSAQSKIGRGISNINKQLKEMERFLNWYGKIKNESGVDNKSYWKRTNNHIYTIKERLIKLDQKIRQISE